MQFSHTRQASYGSWLSPGFWCLGVLSLLLHLGAGVSQGLDQPSRFESVSQLELLVLKQDKLYQTGVLRDRKSDDTDNPLVGMRVAFAGQVPQATDSAIRLPDRIPVRPVFTFSRVPQAPPAVLAFG